MQKLNTRAVLSIKNWKLKTDNDVGGVPPQSIQENSLKKSTGETLIVEDIFAQIKDEQDKNYLYTIYILDKDRKLYSIDLKTKKQTPFAVCVKDEKVKTIKYDEKNKKIESIIITYINGDYKKITNTNDNIITSTIYDKKNDSLIK